jgi:hypothetical protein
MLVRELLARLPENAREEAARLIGEAMAEARS